MSHSALNRADIWESSRKQLVNQLVFFDEEKMAFLDQYFSDYDAKRTQAERVLDTYIAELERILANFNEEKLRSRVLIGSRVDVRDLEFGTTDSYTIVFPHKAKPEDNVLSFLSPLAFQLLLGEKGETYTVHVPSGTMEVRVEDIRYVNGGDPT